jgi:hypothetical protein
MHHSAANTHTCVNSWAPSHQANSNMQKCPSWTIYKCHFPNTPGNSKSLPYGTPRAGSASMLTTKAGKRTCQRIPEAKWEIQNIHTHPYQTALGSGQHSGLNKFNNLPNDHPQDSEGPDKTSALLISTDQPHNYCNVDEAPQNSSSQNLTLLGQCKAITCKFTTTCYFLYGLHADPIYRLHHCSCAVGFSCRDRPQNSFLHSLSSSTLLARTRPVWGRGECAIAFSF